MWRLIPVGALLLAFPQAASAQIDILLSGNRPVVRADLGIWSVSATLGSRGVDLSVGERATARGSTGRSTPRVPETTSKPRTTTTRTAGRAAGASAGAVLSTADNYLGTPYVWGGTSPSGFDCSGYVQYVFREHGIELPRTSRQQAQVGVAVTKTLRSLQPGDLMFFAANGTRIDHIAIYAGNNEIIHSSKSGGGVGYDNLSTKRGQWFVDHHVATRRVLAEGRSLVGPLTAALRAFAAYDPPDRAPRR